MSGGSGTTAANTLIDGFTIQNGKASQGAGIYFNSNAATVSHNIIRLNTSLSTASGAGAGIDCSASSPVIVNNWIVGNQLSNTMLPTPAYLPEQCQRHHYQQHYSTQFRRQWWRDLHDGFHLQPDDHQQYHRSQLLGYLHSLGHSRITYNDVWSNANDASDTQYWKQGTPEVNNNISVDPLMADLRLGDLRIKSGPCKDTGSNAVVSTLPDLLDITRNIRQNGQIDIGANEWTTADPVSTPFVVRVKPNGNDANDGSNWTSAKRTIQAAIDYAFASGGGEVWVKVLLVWAWYIMRRFP